MKTLGTEQLLAMKFERLALPEEWKGVLGNLAYNFVIIIYGGSGNGKTEFCIKLARMLASFGKVEWLSYEQGHGADIQDAVRRNDIRNLPVTWTDPWSKLPPGVPLFDDLVGKMSKKKSAKFWFIDSYDATNFTEAQILDIQTKFGKKKGIVWIAHTEGRAPDKKVARKIEYYGQAGILVKDFIAKPKKNRFGGFEAYVIWEQGARERNPLFFEKQEPVAEVKKLKKQRVKKVKE